MRPATLDLITDILIACTALAIGAQLGYTVAQKKFQRDPVEQHPLSASAKL